MSRFRETLTDQQLLEIMALHEIDGLTAREIAARFGKTRSAICGIIHRINTETDLHDLTPHRNGTMPARWWKRRVAA